MPRVNRPLPPPPTCPVCGEDVPANARACPGCGADHSTGWKPGATAQADLGLPDEEFDYDDFVQREFAPEQRRARGIKKHWWITAVILLAAFVFFYALHFR
jgi:predicted nucleic acid-binding Zn ribbon protein